MRFFQRLTLAEIVFIALAFLFLAWGIWPAVGGPTVRRSPNRQVLDEVAARSQVQNGQADADAPETLHRYARETTVNTQRATNARLNQLPVQDYEFPDPIEHQEFAEAPVVSHRRPGNLPAAAATNSRGSMSFPVSFTNHNLNEDERSRRWAEQISSTIPHWFHNADTDSDGQIALQEWQAAGAPINVFRHIDQNEDGFVTPKELIAAVQQAIAAKQRAKQADSDRGLFVGLESPGNPNSLPDSRPWGLLEGEARRSSARTPGSPGIAVPARQVAKSTAEQSAAPNQPTPSAPTPKTIPFNDDARATMAMPLDDGSNPYWVMRNEQNLERIATGRPARLLFLGDSITDLLSSGAGQPLWDKYFAPLSAANLAVGGSTTSEVLWQIETGQVARLNPESIVLLIGSNNVACGQSPSATANGITKIVNELQQQLPQTRILLLGILPRAESGTDPIRAKILELNRAISVLNDGNALRFLNFSSRFLQRDGTLPEQIMPDTLHPSLAGYQIYATSIWPTLTAMLARD